MGGENLYSPGSVYETLPYPGPVGHTAVAAAADGTHAITSGTPTAARDAAANPHTAPTNDARRRMQRVPAPRGDVGLRCGLRLPWLVLIRIVLRCRVKGAS